MPEEPTVARESCLVCSGGAFRTLATPGQWIGQDTFGDLVGRLGLVRCRGCGVVFVNPRPSDERLGAFYAGDNYSCHETASSSSSGAKAEYLLERIATRMPTTARRTLLDFGAGGGGFLLHARAGGWQVQGFEPGRKGLVTCRAVGLDVTDSIDSLPSGHFGLITLHHVFEHLTDPIRTLRELRRMLAPEGILFIEVPNSRSMRATLALPAVSRYLNADERYRAFPIHLVYYCEETLRRLLRRADWRVDYAFTVGLGLDEYFRGRTSATKRTVERPRSVKSRRRLKHLIREAFLGMGWGENLAVIARPGGDRYRTAP
jgi:SAM-dependent methyltransferase